jgi:hypothetical protein
MFTQKVGATPLNRILPRIGGYFNWKIMDFVVTILFIYVKL